MSTAAVQKGEGDISAAFASLSGLEFKPLEARYADVKAQLIAGHHEDIRASWNRLLETLRTEIPIIAEKGSSVIPEIDFKDIDNPSATFQAEYRKRGVAVIRNVVPQSEALQFKEDIRDYLAKNPHTKAFPPETPQVYELYWSPSQIRARTHPNLLKTQKFLMTYWHSKDPNALVSTAHPVVYPDRLRMRMPGDAKFALGPHVDGGGPERWEPEGYGRGKVYKKIWEGNWEAYDPWESSCRLPVVSDMWGGIGACSMFRMAQGWLSMSETGPNEGTLLVNPLLAHATAYYLLRPFFEPIAPASDPNFLQPSNWKLQTSFDSWLQGATQGHGQELRPHLHPHLNLEHSMVHVPKVQPGDYVAWHCDTIHAVDSVHRGKSDSSVMYIPTCALTETNADQLRRCNQAFSTGVAPPDFSGGDGEKNHVGRPTIESVKASVSDEGLKALGLKPWDIPTTGLTPGQEKMLHRSNQIMGFE